MKSYMIPFAVVLALATAHSARADFRENATLNVPSEYATIQDALDALDEKTISRNVLVTIAVADGTHNISDAIVVGHPYANRIAIVGNVSTPANCVLNFNNGSHGFVIDGVALRSIDGFTIQGNDTTDSLGVFVKNSGFVQLERCVIKDFYIGMDSIDTSSITCASAITINSCPGYGVFTSRTSHVYVFGSTVTNCGTAFSASFSGSIDARSSTLSGNTTNYNFNTNGYIAQ